jgi:hypothetical protein
MIWAIRNWSIFKTVTDTNMEQLENSIHEVDLEMSDMCSPSYSTNVSAIFAFFPYTYNCDSSTLATACGIHSPCS